MASPTTLEGWLVHCERLHHKPKDRPLDELRALRDRLGLRFDCPVIVVAGTNGKGSSCAMLEAIARAAGYRVGVYSKPHLVRFEERCRIDGQPIDGAALLPHFEAVEAARGELPLTWFEFTTFVILRALAGAGLDFAVLEVGLGGRLDAVNVIDADCVLLTSIDLDHIETLGNNREAIGLEKAHVMRSGRPAIVADPQPPQSVLDHGTRIGADLWLVGRDFTHAGDRQQWTWGGRQQRYAGLGYPALRGANQLLNAAGVLAAFEALRLRLPIPAQAVRTGLAVVDLPGRFQVVPGQPTLVLDVSHNMQSVSVLAANLKAMGGFHKHTFAVFGAMRDKQLAPMIERMRRLVDHWYLCALPTERAASPAELGALAGESPHSTHESPAAALRAALAAAEAADRIVVFGSFHTVGGVLKDGLPRLSAPHLG
ncbi:MAG TPA: folylpolyglutamate synthase/dihydrofolate synthase family protein [Rubrivivax sp.]|nr:bifunctional folylpolyglutamate synthase/dihydrofolate synthase [Burkholderiales bacterium]HNT39239.1 folylpolyglutamate synthase/dihydrofolate synthase family protein [Rubrivivax sp.]